MNTSFLDANIFIRYLTNDDPVKADRVEILLDKAARGEFRLVTTELVIAEVVWVLESYYGFTKAEIKEVIDTILETKNVKVTNHSRVKEAVNLYTLGKMDFIDAYNIAYIRTKGCRKVATFDVKHFKNIEGIISIW